MLGLDLECQNYTGLKFTMAPGLGAERLNLLWKGLPSIVPTGFLSFPFEQVLEFPTHSVIKTVWILTSFGTECAETNEKNPKRQKW